MILAMLLAAPAAAAPRHIIVQELEYPWAAIGRLNVAGHSYCSAVMISERHLLTAAHCLWNRGESRWWPASAVHFVPGFQGDAVLVARLKSYVVADGYHFVLHPAVADLATDWAVAELDAPLGRQTGWLASGPAGGVISAGESPLLGHAGYRQDHRYGLSLDYGCHLLGWGPQGTVFGESCEDMAGDSGGPVLIFTPDGPRVVGIVVATTRRVGGQTLAVPLDALADTARFPAAAKAAQAAGVGRNAGQGPASGGVVAAGPQATLRTLGAAAGQPASLAELTRVLVKTAGEGPKP